MKTPNMHIATNKKDTRVWARRKTSSKNKSIHTHIRKNENNTVCSPLKQRICWKNKKTNPAMVFLPTKVRCQVAHVLFKKLLHPVAAIYQERRSYRNTELRKLKSELVFLWKWMLKQKKVTPVYEKHAPLSHRLWMTRGRERVRVRVRARERGRQTVCSVLTLTMEEEPSLRFGKGRTVHSELRVDKPKVT